MAKKKPITIRAIEANPGDINDFAQKLENVMRSFSRMVQKEIIDALEANADQLIAQDADLKKTGINADANKTDELLTRILEMQKKNFLGKYNTRISRLVSQYVSKTHKSVNNAQKKAFTAAGINLEDTKGIKDFEKSNPHVTKMKAGHAVALSDKIKDFMSSQMNRLKMIAVGTITTGGSTADLKERYDEKDNIDVICKQIANNSGRNMAAEAQQSNAKMLGIKEGIWVHRPGAWSSRKSHKAMDGKKFSLGKGMWDPDEGKFVMPGELPACRCSFRAVFDGFE